ncbi:hypothetical protein BH10BAC2_BH10BAC2_07890 [soil metagenome]
MLLSGFADIYEPLYKAYKNSFNKGIVKRRITKLSTKSTPVTKDTFGFCTSIASVYSSKIEGEVIELDSYIKHKFLSVTYVADYTKKPDDLFGAYDFARKNKLNQGNIFHAHGLLSKHLLTSNKRGRVRTQQMFIMAKNKQIEYVAADASIVKPEYKKLMNDLNELIDEDLALDEIFFYASMMHLLFVKIHPLYDGNGRTGRLFEKWFLAQKLGEAAWNIESERYYYENINVYYKNLQQLGLRYEILDNSKALPFTQLLVKSLAL